MQDYIVIDNFLTNEECQALINTSEDKGYDEADISYSSGARMDKEYRDNMRCLYEDENFRLKLETLLEPFIPQKITYREKELNFLKVSGKFRFYKYNPGQKFKEHKDGNIMEEGGISLYTILIYLNTAEDGGETGIYDMAKSNKILVKAETGKMLMFNHSVLHTGEELKAGLKYILRSDLVYELPIPE